MTKIILLRHGKTIEGKAGIILGQLGGNLSKAGKVNIRNLAQKIRQRGHQPDLIISSNLQRATQSAEIISEVFANLPVKIEPLVCERSAGEVAGKYEKNVDWETYERSPWAERKHHHGESFAEVYRRAQKFIESLENYSATEIIVVTHAAFGLMFLAAIAKTNPEKLVKSRKYNLAKSAYVVDLEKKQVTQKI